MSETATRSVRDVVDDLYRGETSRMFATLVRLLGDLILWRARQDETGHWSEVLGVDQLHSVSRA